MDQPFRSATRGDGDAVELSLSEAESAAKLVGLFVRALEAGDFDRRIRALGQTAR